MRVLLTGASGLFGANFILQHSTRFEIIAAAHHHPIGSKLCSSVAFDLIDPDGVARAIEEARPQAIVHAAAMTSVDACEDDSVAARLINSMATESVARAAAAVKAHLVYISTDYVFDGKKGRYTEIDTPEPLGVYARTKWEGEQAVLDLCPTGTIARTTIYGWNAQDKESFAERVLLATPEKPVTAFTDMYWSPILANDLADAVAQMLEHPKPGIFHVAGRTRCSRYQFAEAVVQIFGRDPASVRCGLLSEAGGKLKAPRPPDASLDVSQFEKIYQTVLPGYEDGLKQMKELGASGWSHRLKELLAPIPA